MDNTYYIKNKSVYSTQIDEETGLINPSKGYYFMLNETGSIIWNLIESNNSIDNIVNKLIQEYAIEYDDCFEEVNRVVNEMVSEDLIERVPT